MLAFNSLPFSTVICNGCDNDCVFSNGNDLEVKNKLFILFAFTKILKFAKNIAQKTDEKWEKKNTQIKLHKFVT